MIITISRRKLAKFISIEEWVFKWDSLFNFTLSTVSHAASTVLTTTVSPTTGLQSKWKKERKPVFYAFFVNYYFSIISFNFVSHFCLDFYHDALYRRNLIIFKAMNTRLIHGILWFIRPHNKPCLQIFCIQCYSYTPSVLRPRLSVRAAAGLR